MEGQPTADTCAGWRPGDCEGTPFCPPRCPRWIAPDGSRYTIEDRRIESADGSGRSDRPVLVATREAGTVGEAMLLEETAPPLVAVTSEDGPALAAELARQVIARRFAGATDRLRILGPAGPMRTVAAELGGGGSVRTGDPEEFLERVSDLRASGFTATAGDDGLDGQSAVLTVDLKTAGAARMALPPARRADVPAGRDLSALFDPDVVAVVGATDREGSIGRVVMENLRSSFAGEVIPVTDRRETVLGVPAVETPRDLAGRGVDLALVILPADAVLEAVESLADADVGAIAVLSAGFGEVEDEAGAERERRLATLVETNDLLLVGPNAMGVLSTRGGLNASFAPTTPAPGGVSIASHSGAMVTALLEWASAAGVGVRDVVSVGNAVGIDEGDLLRHWGRDPHTDVIVLYLEDLAGGRSFVEAAREVSRTTPILALKGGRSDAGAAAAASHTGALVGEDAGFDAAFDRGGVVRVDSQHELTDLTRALASQPIPPGRRIAVVTNAGGPGVVATDAVADTELELAELTDGTAARLREFLPAAASVGNPLDVLGDADVERFAKSLEVVLADPGVDAAMVVSTPHPLVDRDALIRSIDDAGRRHGTPVVTCFSGWPELAVGDGSDRPSTGSDRPSTGSDRPSTGSDRRVDSASPGSGEESDAGTDLASFVHPGGPTDPPAVPNYPDATRAADVLAGMATVEGIRRRADPEPERPPGFDAAGVREALAQASTDGRTTLGPEAAGILEAAGVSVPEWGLAATPSEAARIARGIAGPVALKAVGPGLEHRTDVGGVALDVSPDAVEETASEVLDRVRAAAPQASIDGLLVQAQVEGGVECLVGITRHPRFGPVVTVGLGGVLVEQLGDVSHRLAPAAPAEVSRMLDELEGAGILTGARGAEPVDRQALIDAVVRLSWIPHVAEEVTEQGVEEVAEGVDERWVAELEVNPVIATPDGVAAVDLLVRVGDRGA